MALQNNKQTQFDVVILGGGPAGTAAGLTLLKSPKVNVAIVEKSHYESFRVGESLSPGTRSLLEYLDVWPEFQQRQSMQSFGSQASWGAEEMHSLDYLFTTHGNGWHLDRVDFDRMLAQSFRNRGGALLTDTSFLSCEKTDGDCPWRLSIRNERKEEQLLSCKFVIDASGRNSRFCKEVAGTRQNHDRLLGLVCNTKAPEEAKVLETFVQVEACEYGWWYSAPLPDNRVSVVLMTDADVVNQKRATIPEHWQALLQQTRHTFERVKHLKLEPELKVFNAWSSCLTQAIGDGWLAVGDAAASYDPLSSSGIPHAMGGGINGAIVALDILFADGAMAPAYQEAVHQDFNQYLQTHWRYYLRENRWPEAPFWARRQAQVKINPLGRVSTVQPLDKSMCDSALFVSSQHSAELHRLCQPGKLVHEIAREFIDANPAVPDIKAILGLQQLVEREDIALNCE